NDNNIRFMDLCLVIICIIIIFIAMAKAANRPNKLPLLKLFKCPLNVIKILTRPRKTTIISINLSLATLYITDKNGTKRIFNVIRKAVIAELVIDNE
ncbi:MAG: hypothetical protein K0R49_1348, partial [Burkholderiales bacterium]|nr:hypothetical protein [Burkholderiales bacterium]